MIEKSQLTLLNKQYAKSFNEQKSLIKKVLAGRTVVCHSCHKTLSFNTADNKVGTIRCDLGCTDIELDLAD